MLTKPEHLLLPLQIFFAIVLYVKDDYCQLKSDSSWVFVWVRFLAIDFVVILLSCDHFFLFGCWHCPAAFGRLFHMTSLGRNSKFSTYFVFVHKKFNPTVLFGFCVQNKLIHFFCLCHKRHMSNPNHVLNRRTDALREIQLILVLSDANS